MIFLVLILEISFYMNSALIFSYVMTTTKAVLATELAVSFRVAARPFEILISEGSSNGCHNCLVPISMMPATFVISVRLADRNSLSI